MLIYVENCSRSLFSLARHQLTALRGIERTFQFVDKRQFLSSSIKSEAVGTHVCLPFAVQTLSLKFSKSWNVSQTAAYSSDTSDHTFKDILSSPKLEQYRNVLQSKKHVDVKNLPWLRGRKISDMKAAAVLIPLCLVDGQPSVLFTLRSNHLPTHKGEVCFPGGMVDKKDKGYANTALRELEEEIGLKKESVEVIGQMIPIPAANYAMLTTPILGFCGDVDLKKLKVDEQEVSDVFASSICSLCDKKNVEYTTYKGKPMITMPVFTGQKYKIWGMTAIMLHKTLELIAPKNYHSEFRF